MIIIRKRGRKVIKAVCSSKEHLIRWPFNRAIAKWVEKPRPENAAAVEKGVLGLL